MNRINDKLIVALDYSDWNEAALLVDKLPEVRNFKVGLELYLASKGSAVQELQKRGKDVFLDLKFHDIPNTVGKACGEAVLQGATIFNVHTSGGIEMMRQAVKMTTEYAVKYGKRRPLLIGVTVLTSMNDADLQNIGMVGVETSVRRLALLAKEAGLDGVVASPQEISLIRQACGSNFKIICPGVRPAWAGLGDQKRVMTPGEALKMGADYLVIGRPITKADDPEEAARKILKEMKEGLM